MEVSYDNNVTWEKLHIDEEMIPVLDEIIGRFSEDYYDKKDEQFGKFEEDKMPDGFIPLTVSYEGRPVEEPTYISEIKKKFLEAIFDRFNLGKFDKV